METSAVVAVVVGLIVVVAVAHVRAARCAGVVVAVRDAGRSIECCVAVHSKLAGCNCPETGAAAGFEPVDEVAVGVVYADLLANEGFAVEQCDAGKMCDG